MRSKKLDLLVEEIQKQYRESQGDYEMSSIFGSVGPSERMDLCKYMVNKINEIYQTKYQVKEYEDNKREYGLPR